MNIKIHEYQIERSKKCKKTIELVSEMIDAHYLNVDGMMNANKENGK